MRLDMPSWCREVPRRLRFFGSGDMYSFDRRGRVKGLQWITHLILKHLQSVPYLKDPVGTVFRSRLMGWVMEVVCLGCHPHGRGGAVELFEFSSSEGICSECSCGSPSSNWRGT